MARISIIAPGFLTDPSERLPLEAKGHVVAVHKDIRSALEAVLNDPPEVMVIEKGLPGDMDKVIIQAIKDDLKLSFLPVILVCPQKDILFDMDWNEYPVDDYVRLDASCEELLTRVELALARSHRIADNNPLTGLPGNTSILKTIQCYLKTGLERAVGYCDIDNFKPLNDKYGFSRGDEVIRMVARVLVNVVQEKSRKEGFVGHVGGDDFVFAVPIPQAEEVARKIIANFDSLITLFFDQEDAERGYFEAKDRQGRHQRFPLTSLSIAVVPCTKGRFSHYGEVAHVAAEIKKKVKAIEGSAFLIDRRKS